jgi:hypothetical protein
MVEGEGAATEPWMSGTVPTSGTAMAGDSIDNRGASIIQQIIVHGTANIISILLFG